jgi:uncharacterized protein (TIGR04255 family)
LVRFLEEVRHVTIHSDLATSPLASRGRARRKYDKPSIAEAVCEFQFRGSTDWDWTILGLVYQAIQAEFPQKRQEKNFEIRVAPQEGKVEQNVGGSLSKMQFVREDGSAMVQVGPDLLAINVLPPYPGWEGFEELIRRQFEVYNKIARPVGFKRIGLRYINKILFSTKGIETTDYFHYYPHLPATLEPTHGPFAMRVQHNFEDERDALAIQMGHIKGNDGNIAIGLDLDYYLVEPDRVELSKGLEWVSRAHERVEDMFEACITDKTRRLLEEVGR